MNLISNVMENWNVELIARGQTLAEVKIQRGILKGDKILPLLFVIAMKSLKYVLKKYTKASNLQNHKKRLITLCTSMI